MNPIPKVVEKGTRKHNLRPKAVRTIHTQTRRRRRLPEAVVLATKAAVQIPLLRHRTSTQQTQCQHVKQTKITCKGHLGDFFWGPLACPGRRTLQPSPCASLGSPLAAVAAARTRDLQLRLVKQPTQVRLAPARDKKLLVVDAMVRHTRDPLPPSREINK